MQIQNILTIILSVFLFVGSFLFSSSIFASFAHESENISKRSRFLQFSIIISLGLGIYTFLLPLVELIDYLMDHFFI